MVNTHNPLHNGQAVISYRKTLVVSSGNNTQNASFNVTAGGTYNNHCATKGNNVRANGSCKCRMNN